MVYGIRYMTFSIWYLACGGLSLNGSHSLHFPKTRDTRNQRKTSIKAASVHNLKRRSSELCLVRSAVCGLFVWKVDDGDANAKMNCLAWLSLAGAHGNAHQPGDCPRKKEVNCRLLSENESVCRKTTRPDPLNRFSRSYPSNQLASQSANKLSSSFS